METQKISIIIPIYNTVQYLEECIQSVINQTYKNIEIILVNDGSTDGSGEICEKFANRDTRIKYLCQENKGVTAARRLGVEYASGEYIGFVDSDDYIESDLYEQIANIITEQKNHQLQIDVLVLGMKKGYGEEEVVAGKIPNGIYADKKSIEYLIDNMIAYEDGTEFGIWPNVCAKVFNCNLLKRILKDISDAIVFGEDGVCSYKCLLKSNVVVLSSICGYYYRMRDDSTIHSINKRYLRNVDLLYYELSNEFQKHPQSKSLMNQLDIWIGRMIAQSPFYMGLNKSVGQVLYFFPRMDIIAGKRVVLYGAGKVGYSYYTLFKKTNCCEIVKWVDKKIVDANQIDISPVDAILNIAYDYIVIAVKSATLAEDITMQLINWGHLREKILWEYPCE